MKINLKDLRPNPYRDSERYPIHREKVETLKASIRTTGFWDNVLVRKSSDGKHYEIAYGHHRLEALRELVHEKLIEADFQLDLPVRNLDDAAMIRIMANENVQEYRVTSEIIDETVRVTREFIQQQSKTPLNEISASDISQFLGGTWNEDRVDVSLKRLGLFDRGTLKREQLKGMSHSAARSVQREVARVEKTMTRDKLESQAASDDEEVTEQDRKRIRSQVQKVANHVAQALSDHLRNGGGTSEVREKSIEAQAEMVPEDAPPDERALSTIDSAARGINAKEFQRKVELLLRYRAYMSTDARDELTGKLSDLANWCKQSLGLLDEE